MNRTATLYEIPLIKSSVLLRKDQIRKRYHKLSLLKHPDAGGDKGFFKTIIRANQILTNDAAREAYNIFGIDKAGKFMNSGN